MVDAISEVSDSHSSYSSNNIEKDNISEEKLENSFEHNPAKKEHLQRAPFYQKNLWFLFSTKAETVKEKQASLHYAKAMNILKQINVKLQKWEEDFEENDPTPTNQEEMQKDLVTLLKGLQENIDTAIQIFPSYPGFYIVRGVAEMLWGHFEIAKENFEKSISLNPNFSDSQYHILPGDAELLCEICKYILEDTPKL